MRNLSRQFRQMLHNNERNYLCRADITLTNATALHLDNSNLWTGGFSFEESVSEDESFTAVGSAIIGSAHIVINNIYETFSSYDFTDATVVLYLGMMVGETLEEFRVGTYTVDEATYNGGTISLSLLDYLEKFDRPYSDSSLSYTGGVSIGAVVRDLCTVCGVTLETQTFPHIEYQLFERPNDEATTCREVLAWCATIAGCYVKCNPYGNIIFGWFDTAPFDGDEDDLEGGTFNPWTAGTTANGGTFNPWTEGNTIDAGLLADEPDMHYIFNLYSQNISTDDVVITAVSILVKDESQNATQDIVEYKEGQDGYVITIENNPLINTSNAGTIVNWLGAQLNGLTFRKLSVDIASDPAIETGDIAFVIDRKENMYRALITRVSFSADGNQTVICGASTPARNKASKFAAATKSYVEARKLLDKQAADFNTAISNVNSAVTGLSNALAEKSGLYCTVDSGQQGNIFYLHDKSNLNESKVVWKMNSEALAVTTDYKGAQTVWTFGVQVNGTVIANYLATIGIDASWINAGELSADYIYGGRLRLGGTQNARGRLQILDDSGNLIGQWDKDGIEISKGSFICYETYS